jgi:hypothetical protein
MKFAMKSIVAAAAFVAVGAASAATVTVSGTDTYKGFTATGTGALTFSDTLVSALNTGKITVEAVGSVSSIDGTPGAYNAVAVTAPVNKLAIDNTNDQILTAYSSGGARQTAADGTAISCKTSAGVVYNCGNGVATGGNVFVGNFTVDLVNKAIYGDVTGTGLALANNITNSKGTVVVAAHGAVTVNEIGIKLFDFTTITGPTALAGEGTYNTSFTGLALTTAGFTAISNGLGLYSIGKTALQGAAADFGQLDSVITVTKAATPNVPEPSTYALMGLGLVGLSLVARRRAK